MTGMGISKPFGEGGPIWRQQGHPGTLPLPPRKKKSPPEGFTGRNGRTPTSDEIAEWERLLSHGNLAIRLQKGQCGLDVDAWKPEGLASFEYLLSKCGPLPPTWISTSRTDGVSGIRLFRIPDDAVLKGAPMAGIEVCQYHHRYVIVRPSIHDITGDTYKLISPNGELVDVPPHPDELPWLPGSWLEELRERPRTVGERRERRYTDEMARPVRDTLAEALSAMTHAGGRHDAARDAALALARYEELGYPGASDAIETLRSAFTHAISDRANAKQADREWDDLIDSALEIVRSTPPTAPRWEDLTNDDDTGGNPFAGVIDDDTWANRGGARTNPRPDPDDDGNVIPIRPEPVDQPLELAPAAFHGPAGEWVRAVQDHTPAPPGPLLVQFLTVAGAYYGARAFFQVGATPHYPRVYVGVVGRTASGRKGDGLALVENLYRRVDPDFASTQIVSGISSGEGLIARLADPAPDPITGLSDGPPDKRMVVREAELARVLAQSRREGNIISAVLRDAWDRQGDLAVLTRNQPLNAKNTHIAVIGHITPMELSARTSELDAANGLLNRFVWVWSEETKRMPRPPSIDAVAGDQLDAIAARVKATLTKIGKGRVEFTPAAAELWDTEVYGSLTGIGVIESLMARADPYMIRLALIYALLDDRDVIDVVHLQAAHAVGRYWLAGVERQWGHGLSDDAAKLLALCREVRAGGVSVRRHRAILSGHADSKRLERVRDELVRAGVGVVGQMKTTGRPATMVWAVEYAPEQHLPDGSEGFVRSRGTKSDESRAL